MANRYFNQFRLSLEKQVVDLFWAVTYGAAGAPTLSTTNAKGILSVTRTSAGLYVVTFQDSYLARLKTSYVQITATAPAAPIMTVVSSTATTLTVQFWGPTAAGNTALIATDPGSGESTAFMVSLRNSSAF